MTKQVKKEMKMPDYKPFDLEAAKKGAPIITRVGRAAKFIAHVPQCREDARVIVLIEGDRMCYSFCENGHFLSRYEECGDDLFMAMKQKGQEMTKEEFAQLLGSKADFAEQSEIVRTKAKDLGLIVIANLYGRITLCGAFNKEFESDDEAGPYEDLCFKLDKDGVLPSWQTVLDERYSMEGVEIWLRDFKEAHLVTLKWDVERDYWFFETDLPHAKFVLKNCEGKPRGDAIVIDAKDLQ